MSEIMERMAYHYGADSKAWNWQRVVPEAFINYADIWLAGYDGKPMKKQDDEDQPL